MTIGLISKHKLAVVGQGNPYFRKATEEQSHWSETVAVRSVKLNDVEWKGNSCQFGELDEPGHHFGDNGKDNLKVQAMCLFANCEWR